MRAVSFHMRFIPLKDLPMSFMRCLAVLTCIFALSVTSAHADGRLREFLQKRQAEKMQSGDQSSRL